MLLTQITRIQKEFLNRKLENLDEYHDLFVKSNNKYMKNCDKNKELKSQVL